MACFAPPEGADLESAVSIDPLVLYLHAYALLSSLSSTI